MFNKFFVGGATWTVKWKQGEMRKCKLWFEIETCLTCSEKNLFSQPAHIQPQSIQIMLVHFDAERLSNTNRVLSVKSRWKWEKSWDGAISTMIGMGLCS